MKHGIPSTLRSMLGCAVLLGAAATRAATYYVDVAYDGANGPSDGSETKPWTRLGDAVPAFTASSGHTVKVAGGLYKSTADGGLEAFGTTGYDLNPGGVQNRVGAWRGGYVGQITGATVDWSEETRVFPTADADTSGMTVIDLTGANARAFYAKSYQHTFTFDGLRFQNATVTQSTYPGGALYNAGGMNASVLYNCVFLNNQTTGDGGGAWFGGRYGTSTNLWFEGNASGSYGGGLWLQPGNSWQNLSDATFITNEAVRGGGALRTTASPCAVTRCRFIGNRATTTATGNDNGRGGAVFVANKSAATFTRCAFRGNEALNTGAAVGNDGYDGASAYLDNCLVADHTGGYAIDVSGSYSQCRASLRHCTVTGNAGGAVKLYFGRRDSTPLCLFWNTVFEGNGAYVLHISGNGWNATDVPDIDHNLLYDNSAGYEFGNATPPTPTVEIAADPLFADAVAGDYRLAFGSPCADAGADLGIADDLDGVARPTRHGFDIGAYEEWQIPIIANRAPVATAAEAEVRAEFTYESAGIATYAWFVIDTADQGTNSLAAWWQSAAVGEKSQGGIFGATFSGLSPATTYFYRCLASNSYDVMWGPAASFKTPASGGATRVWTGLGGDALASNTNNWLDGLAPGPSDYVLLDGSPSNLAWDAAAAQTVARWTQTEHYTGTVTFETRYPDQGAFTLFTVSGDCLVAGGAWTHRNDNTDAVEPWTEFSRLNVAVGGDLALAGDAAITADGLGYNYQKGPGRSTGSFAGGGHGGRGTVGDDWLIRSDTYGSYCCPTNLGSGGNESTTSTENGKGGGAICLEIAGDALFGDSVLITANGHAARGGGAGGSVLIRARTVSGGGTLRANGGGGASNRNHGGGGGRVALILTGAGATFDAFTNAAVIEARGGTAASGRCGAAGTVYLQEPGQAPGAGTLLIDNGGNVAHLAVSTVLSAESDPAALSALVVRNNGILGIRDLETPLAFTDLPLDTAGADQASVHIVSDAAVVWPETLVVDGYTLIDEGLEATLAHLQVGGARPGVLTHPQNWKAPVYGITLTLAGDLTVTGNGRITADAGGFTKQFGPGVGTLSYGHGAAYGGQGSWRTIQASVTYGSVLDPLALGSGTGDGENVRHGGGAIALAVSGTTTVESGGSISATGAPARGGGSGGSVNLRTGTLAGGGTLRADGGNGDSNHPYGGGGRIAVRLTAPGASFDAFDAAGGVIRAPGGTGSGVQAGAAGTVYRESAAGGTVRIDNGTLSVKTNVVTQLPPAYAGSDPAYQCADDFRHVAAVLAGTARLTLTQDLTLAALEIGADTVLDLNGFTLTLRNTLLIDGARMASGTYAAADLPSQVVDADPSATGRIILPQQGTVILFR